MPHHVLESEQPDMVDVDGSSLKRTWRVKDIEEAFVEMLESVDYDAEELMEFVAGPIAGQLDD